MNRIYNATVDQIIVRSYENRRPSTGSNFAKIPIVSEIPRIINPADEVSSKTEKDPKPIKN